MKRYPQAEWLGNGQSGGSFTSGPLKVVLHTTETRTLPGYQSGATAPHLTFAPASLKWYQHTELDIAARALRNEAGGAQTNRDSALQVEIICYSDRATAERVNGLWVANLSNDALDSLRAFIEWAEVPWVWPGRRATSYSQANAPGFRLTPAQWDAFGGVLAHQHVPENTHWDTGALNWDYLMREEDDMPKIPKPAWLPQAVLDELVARGIINELPTEETFDMWRTYVMLSRTLNIVDNAPGTGLQSGDTVKLTKV